MSRAIRTPHQYSQAAPLQRGSACLNCRRRKQRCNGQRPACHLCVHYGRAKECVYDDQEKRCSSLDAQQGGISSWSEGRSNTVSDLGAPADSEGPRPGMFATGDPSTSRSEVPEHVAETLMNYFFTHPYHFNFPISLPRFSKLLQLPPDDPNRPHPGLLMAIMLLSSYLMADEALKPHEPALISKTNHFINGLRTADLAPGKPFDIILAVALLARHSLMSGVVMRAPYLASVAMGLATRCGLHRISLYPSPNSRPNAFMPPPGSFLDISERIDRQSTWETGVPSQVADEDITTPFPISFSRLAAFSGSKTISSLYSQNQSEPSANVNGDVVLAVRAKATALLNRAASLSQGLDHSVFDPTSPAFIQSFNSVDNAITNFLGSLPPASSTSFSQTAINDNEMEDAFLCYSLLEGSRRIPFPLTPPMASGNGLSDSATKPSRTASVLSIQRPQSLPTFPTLPQGLAPPNAHTFLAHTLSLAHIFSYGAIIRLHRTFAFPHGSRSMPGVSSEDVFSSVGADVDNRRIRRRLGPKRHVESVLKAARDMASVVQVLEAQGIEPGVMCTSIGLNVALAINVLYEHVQCTNARDEVMDIDSGVAASQTGSLPSSALVNYSHIDVLFTFLKKLKKVYPGLCTHVDDIELLLSSLS
ncbi:uncharacterized protein EI90DRAFT_3019654 [Cantharellus anzutake]|uniref:uncharacterized protein n=1 Tax=Cantharellus anzutake TaxID=1750568 RepID=UPI001906C5D8|nr:uncharacterized protein EI90DRAFT_3019654 [Cantharellus anzutake]KAF8324296.1 hypothetical protein EI90DRAFT_3019654 [Cantharellus anzutake]